MIAENLIKFFENWAPPGIAWEKDNVGLQVGSAKRRVSNIFLCLELNEKALKEAIKTKADFIFTHHPFIFKPLKKINTDTDLKGRIIDLLLKNNITLYSAHTNLDFTKGGVSFELAHIIGINNPKFLVNQNSNQYKLVVFIPEKSFNKITGEIFKAGAGIIGEYEKCSFSSNGTGSFEGSELTNPNIGNKQKFENVDEIRFEVIVDSWNLNNVIKALRNAHPYEEPAYDIYPVKNENMNYGFGTIGNLKNSLNPEDFLDHICYRLKTNNLRYAKGKSRKIKTVAVCGGGGSDLLSAAINAGADAFITADIKYHTFQEAENRILFIDAGHYETEIHSLNEVKRKLEKFIKFKGERIKVVKYSGSTNPIKYFNKRGVK